MTFLKGAIHRHSEQSDVDFFPTPPWATRALIEHVLGKDTIKDTLVWDSCCGAGHMARVLEEYTDHVIATDLYDYGFGEPDRDFLTWNMSIADWIIINPPFNYGLDFALQAIKLAKRGVCLLTRTQWIEGKRRYESLFSKHPPIYFAPFVERVAMLKNRYDPNATTAMSYAWFVWMKTPMFGSTITKWIPSCKDKLTKEDDVAKFAGVFERKEAE